MSYGSATRVIPGWQPLLRSFGALSVGEGAARLLGFLVIVLMARRMGPGAFGVVILGTTMVNWFRLVVDTGTEVLAVRDVSREPGRFRELVEPLLGVRLALSLAVAAPFVAVAALVPTLPKDREVLLLFAVVLPMVALNLRWIVLGVRSAKAVALGNVASQLLVAAGVVYFVRGRHDLNAVPLLMAAGEALYALVVALAVTRRFGFPRPRVDWARWRSAVTAGLPLMANGIARTVMYSFDVFLIAWLLTRRDLGFYGAAYKPVLFASTLVGLFSVAFLSAYSGSASDRDRAALLRRTTRTTALAGIALAIALTAAAPLVVDDVYGSEYAAAATPLVILAWTIPLLALAGPFASAMIAADRRAELMRHNVLGALLNAGGNLAAIPLFGLPGAAAVTVASFALVLALNYRAVTRLQLVAPPVAPLPAAAGVVDAER